MNNYNQQAKEFLTKTNSTLKIEYLKTGKHFNEDKENGVNRDIYQVILANNKNAFSFTFGDSVQNTEANKNRGIRIKPNAYSILACLTKYDPGTFEDFINEFGYNDQSLSEYPKVKKIYNDVVKEYKNLLSLYTDAEIDILREIN